MPRALSEVEKRAVTKFLPTVDTEKLAIINRSEGNGLIDPQYVVDAEKFQEVDHEAVRSINHAIVCSLLWLARLDEQEAVREKRAPEFAYELYPHDELEYPEGVHVLDHSLSANDLTEIRNEQTDTMDYRHHLDRLAESLITMATQDLALEYETITTPTGVTLRSPRLSEEVVLVSVLRAGESMVPAGRKFLSKSGVGRIGLKRNEETARPELYHYSMPQITEKTVVVVMDPMLATGGSSIMAIQEIMKRSNVKPKAIRFVGLIAAPEGLEALRAAFPDIQVYLGAIDSHLNETAYIIPGLGDAGDREAGT